MSAQEDVLAAVTGLARDVEAQRRRLDALAGLPDHIHEIALTLHDLTENAAAPARRAKRPVTWLGWSSQNEADPRASAALLRDLAGWLNSVFLRYGDAVDSLPDCWLWHPDVVEELLWLRQAWTAAYASSAAITSAADWHDRQRPGVVRRLRSGAGMCSLDKHATSRIAAAPTADHIPLVATWWTTAPHEPPPVPPCDGAAG